MQGKYTVLAIASLLVACGTKPSPEAYNEQNNSCGNFLTNDEIIATTQKCNQAGLDAVSLHCGDDYQTVIVECRPRPLGQTSGE